MSERRRHASWNRPQPYTLSTARTPFFLSPLLPLRRLTHLFMRASVPSLSFFLSELCIKSKIKYHVGRINNIVAYVVVRCAVLAVSQGWLVLADSSGSDGCGGGR